MVRSMSKAGSIFHRPIASAKHTTVNTATIALECLKVKSLRRSIHRLRRVLPSPSAPGLGLRSLPNESSTGVITRVFSKTNSIVSELVRPTHFVGRIGITMNESSETTVVNPQKTTDQPISLIVSTTACRRLPWMRMQRLK